MSNINFTCPKCMANVNKERGDLPGCPCCGFAVENSNHKLAKDPQNGQECTVCHEHVCTKHILLG